MSGNAPFIIRPVTMSTRPCRAAQCVAVYVLTRITIILVCTCVMARVLTYILIHPLVKPSHVKEGRNKEKQLVYNTIVI